jgi:hypothetical protein
MANTQAGLYTSSSIINGQLVPQTRSGNFFPFAVGPVVQGVPASPPQSPPGYSGGGGGDRGASVTDAANNPWSPTKSPVPWLIGMFVVGFLLMRYVHWGYK